MQPATTATDPESRPLTMLTQKPRFSTGNLCVLTWPAPAPKGDIAWKGPFRLLPGCSRRPSSSCPLSPPTVRPVTGAAHGLEHFFDLSGDRASFGVGYSRRAGLLTCAAELRGRDRGCAKLGSLVAATVQTKPAAGSSGYAGVSKIPSAPSAASAMMETGLGRSPRPSASDSVKTLCSDLARAVPAIG
jgi:hypothetical protein